MDNIYNKLSEKRKQLQEQGLVPEWYSTSGFQLFENKYEYETNGRSVKGQFERIAKTAASHVPQLNEAEGKFFELLWKGWLSPSTPVMANTGTTRGMPVSCSGTVAQDSIDGFYSNLHEVAMLTKNGFGTASDFSNIRPRGTAISVGGKASGVVPVIKEHVQTMRNVAQGTARRGAWAVYLDIEHGDFHELIDTLNNDPDDLNIGWTIKQTFIDKLNAKDAEATLRFKRAMKSKMITGKGYFFFVDKANDKRPLMYKDKGLMINNSQLCSEVMLFNDHEHTYTCILSSMNASKWHEWKDTDAVYWATIFLDCIASEFMLKAKGVPGLEKAILFTEKSRALGLGLCGLHSLFMQDMITFESFEAHMLSQDISAKIMKDAKRATQDMAKILGEPEWCKGYGVRNTHLCVTGDTKVLTKEGHKSIKSLVDRDVEIWNGFEWSLVRPFETGNSKLLSIKFSNGATLKCTPEHKFVVATARRESKGLFPNKTIDVEAKNLRVGDCIPKFFTEKSGSSNTLENAYTAGLFCGDGSVNNSRQGKYPRNELRLYGDKQKLKDFVNWKSDNTWGEGCVRGYLPDDLLPKYSVPHDYSAESKVMWLCGLIDADGAKNSSGITISMKDYSFANDVALLIQSLGGEYSVTKAKRSGGFNSESAYYYVVNISIHSCFKIFTENMKPNRVGVYLGTPKNSVGNTQLNEVISVEFLDDEEMTYCFTEPKLSMGVFNGVLTKQCAIAPTKSTALLMGGISEGINPDPAMCFTQLTSAGEMERVNPILLNLMKEKGVYSKKNIQSIVEKQGSVQEVDWLSNSEKEVFKTAFEINQKAVIRLAAARQIYVDQGQSLNLFFSADESPAWIAEVHKEAFENPNILALYYVHTQSGVQGAKGECEACQ